MTRSCWNNATFGHVLERYRNTCRLPASSEDSDRNLSRILEHVDRLIRQARLDERKRLALLDDELAERITNVITSVMREAAAESGKSDSAA